jgi:hypothetical protein
MSIVAIAAPLFALLGALLAVVGVAGARFGFLSPLAGFTLFAFVGLLLCGALAVVCGAIGLWRTRLRAHRTGAAQAWAGLLAGVVYLVALFLLAPSGGAPPVHDISTDLEDPPRFSAALRLDENRGRDLAYPHGSPDTPQLQRLRYPDVRSFPLAEPPAAALRHALDAARELGWEIVEVREPPATPEGPGTASEAGFEAVDRTPIFRFRDDIVVRVRDEGTSSRIDVRSTSRVGRSDLGANAARIRAFRAALEGED